MIELQSFAQGRRKKIIWLLVLGIVAAIVVFLGIKYVAQARELQQLQQQALAQHTNAKVVGFLQLFMEKVLKTDKEVSFEDRLKLENAVRDINDPVVLQKWEVFIGATTEAQIQAAVKDLLQVLIDRISY